MDKVAAELQKAQQWWESEYSHRENRVYPTVPDALAAYATERLEAAEARSARLTEAQQLSDKSLTDSEFARELSGYVLHRTEVYLGLQGAEIDMDEEVYHMEELIAELRKDFEIPAPPEALAVEQPAQPGEATR